MGKIKLNLVSGAIVEKPLVNAFKANNNVYVVLDNEVNGSMGLPIILVCKFENNKLIKINDQNEWNIVKEYLKNIIAGNKIEFIKIDSELAADDIYYTQLTLPVPSFDALKKAYNIADEPVVDNVSVSAVEQTSSINTNPVVEPAVQTPIVEPVISPVQEPVMQQEPVVTSTPVIDVPVAEPVISPTVEIDVPPVGPVAPSADVVAPIANENIIPVVEPVVQTPVVEPVISPVQEPVIQESDTVQMESIFKEQKEAFMQACENMFDALVQKFEKQLENHK